ncbi:MAG: hypothetical protein GWP70_11970 [Proteobacteria bacterium]|nr:hypothetical protein [Pseudomonadota bacterium]
MVCAEGSWKSPKEDVQTAVASNALRLARALKPTIAQAIQQVFYDWGLGSYRSRGAYPVRAPATPIVEHLPQNAFLTAY